MILYNGLKQDFVLSHYDTLKPIKAGEFLTFQSFSNFGQGGFRVCWFRISYSFWDVDSKNISLVSVGYVVLELLTKNHNLFQFFRNYGRHDLKIDNILCRTPRNNYEKSKSGIGLILKWTGQKLEDFKVWT